MTASHLMVMLLCLGLAAAGFALVIRRAETAAPDPGDIHVRTGLAHMLTGIIAWAAFLSLIFAAAILAGLILPGLAAAALAIALTRRWAGRLIPVYRLQITLAGTALLIAITEWLYLITLVQADPYQIR